MILSRTDEDGTGGGGEARIPRAHANFRPRVSTDQGEVAIMPP
jgi:hypothetical protein